MKKILANLFTVSVAAALFTSCKKEVMPAPAESAAVSANQSSENIRNGGGIIPAPVYVLTRHGKDSVMYYDDGRLAKVRHSLITYTQYNYGFNTITAKTFSGNKLNEEVTYQIDVNTGRTYESEWHGYSYYGGGTIHTQKWHKYEYNADGRITKMYNKLEPAEHVEYLWGWDNNASLANIRWFGKDNKEYKKLEFANVWNKTALRMHLPATGLDVYLNIFGKPNKELPSVEHYWNINNGNATPAAHYAFDYEMNADNYPIVRHRYNVPAQGPFQLLESAPFAYKLAQ